MKIPMYTEQVGSVSRGGAGQINPNVAAMSASGKSSAAKGLQQLGIGTQQLAKGIDIYAKKMEDLKEKAIVSDYEVSKKDFDAGLYEHVNQQLQNEDVNYENLVEKVVIPYTEKFRETLSDSDVVQERWELDSSAAVEQYRMQASKKQADQYAQSIQRHADNLLVSGDVEGGDKMYEYLGGIIGEEEAIKMRSTSTYNRTRLLTSVANEQYSQDGDIIKYIDTLDSLYKSTEEDENILANQKTVTLANLSAQRRNAQTKANKVVAKTVNSLMEEIEKGELDVYDLRGLEKRIGKQGVATFKASYFAMLEEAAGADEKAKTILNEIENSKSFAGSLKRIEDQNSRFGVYAMHLVTEQYEEAADLGDPIAAYESWTRQKQYIKSSPTADRFIKTLAYYARARKEGVASWAEGRIKKFIKWKKDGGDETTYPEFEEKVFTKDASDLAFGTPYVAPPEPTEEIKKAIEWVKANPKDTELRKILIDKGYGSLLEK